MLVASVISSAHNEPATIGRNLRAQMEGTRGNDLDVVVVGRGRGHALHQWQRDESSRS